MRRIISIFQNIIGIAVGTAVGLDTPYALLSSAISMIGGHGAALAYGTTFSEMGYTPAVAVAPRPRLRLISGVMLGGPLGRRLIVKYHLQPEENNDSYTDIESVNASVGEKLSSLDVIKNVTAIFICMALGTMVAGWVGA